MWRKCPSGLAVSVRGGSAVQLIATVRSRPSWNGGEVYLAPHSPPSGLAGPDPQLAGVWEGAVPFDSGKFLCKVSCPCPTAPAMHSSFRPSQCDTPCVNRTGPTGRDGWMSSYLILVPSIPCLYLIYEQLFAPFNSTRPHSPSPPLAGRG